MTKRETLLSPYACQYCNVMKQQIISVKRHIAQSKDCQAKQLADLNNLNEEDADAVGVREVTPEVEYALLCDAETGSNDLTLGDAMDNHPILPCNVPEEQPGTWLPGPDEYNYRMLSPDPEQSGEPTSAKTIRFDRKLGVWIEEYPVPTVGMPIRVATREEMAKHVFHEPENIGALSDPENFEIAELLFQSGLSVEERERFPNLKKFQGQVPWSSNYQMMQDVDKLPHNEDWDREYFELKGSKGVDTEVLFFRNSAEVFRELFTLLDLKDEYHFRPETHYTTQTGEEPIYKEPIYSEAWTGKAWRDIQQKIQDEYGTVGQYIIASDETPLTGFCGNKKAHPVYFTIANLPKHIRRKQSHRAMVLIGYLPVPKLTCEPNKDKARELKNKLYNDCMRHLLKPLTDAERVGMDVVCADGGVRRIYPVLSAAIADFPEQCKNSCIIGSFCPICLVNPNKRGDMDLDVPLRQKDATLKAIIEHREEGSPDFEDFGLHDRWPWWNRHTHLDIATMHSPDLLHQIHKGVFKDHLAKWLVSELGAPTIDIRYQIMPEHHGIRHFKRGISKLSRSTGREAKEMMKVFLPAISDAGPRVVAASHALIKFSYLAHSSSLTESELGEMDKQLAIFHEHKGVFMQWLKSERKFHNIPKFHMLQHYTHIIRMLGTPDGYNTEAPERLHIDLNNIAGFRASNKVDDTELQQMAKYVERMDALAIHRSLLNYLDRPAEEDDCDSDDGSDAESDEQPIEELSGGCVVERVVEAEPEAQGHNTGAIGSSAGLAARYDRQGLKIYYPSPEIVTSKTRNSAITTEYLITTHGTTNIVDDITTFLKKLDPTTPKITLSLDSKIEIWTVARLYHAQLPFKPLEPLQVDHVRAYPPKINHLQRVGRVGHYDTVLVLSYPEKTGIHPAVLSLLGYRAARVRAIFKLPKHLQRLYPHKLIYVEWFNPFSAVPVQHLHTYATTVSLTQAQKLRSAVIPLSSICLACHLGPKFSTIDEETELGIGTDIFTVCKSFFFNQFSNYFTFELFEHWAQFASSSR
ncbi:hypothetical protein RSAG8_11462, partial [Rhizoctonia solani AG-8 WAC10335]